MRIRFGSGLPLLNLLAVILIVVIAFSPSSVFRIILGLPLMLFSPGYVLVMALFPKRGSIGTFERVALSFGLSIVVVPLIGLILNYTPWGIKLEPILYSVTSFIFITSIIAIFRWARLPQEERFSIKFQLKLPGWGGTIFDRFLSIILVVFILGALGTLGYLMATAHVGEKFTEFYILDRDGKAQDYPTAFIMQGDKVILISYNQDTDQWIAGEMGTIILGIVNREQEEAMYSLSIMIDNQLREIYFNGNTQEEIGPITLAHGEKWEHEIGFAPEHIGNNQKVDFVLYKDSVPYFEEPPHLWVDVSVQD